MANFIPLKNYMFYSLDQFIERYGLRAPFLDVGCGVGDLSVYLAQKGWQGKAIDDSLVAISRARDNLKLFPKVAVENKSLFDETGEFQTILIWDVIEHIKDDELALARLASLLAPGGHLLIAVPSNPREWRWDDDFYGHYRRYSKQDMENKLKKVGLPPVAFWDFTYPLFWIMRRLYTFLKKPSISVDGQKEDKTSVSATVNAWDIPVISGLINKTNFIWRLVYNLQFRFFRDKVEQGHEMFVLAQKPSVK